LAGFSDACRSALFFLYPNATARSALLGVRSGCPTQAQNVPRMMANATQKQTVWATIKNAPAFLKARTRSSPGHYKPRYFSIAVAFLACAIVWCCGQTVRDTCARARPGPTDPERRVFGFAIGRITSPADLNRHNHRSGAGSVI